MCQPRQTEVSDAVEDVMVPLSHDPKPGLEKQQCISSWDDMTLPWKGPGYQNRHIGYGVAIPQVDSRNPGTGQEDGLPSFPQTRTLVSSTSRKVFQIG